MFGSEIIDEPDQQDETNRRDFKIGPGHAEIAHGVPATHRRRDDEVRQQQQSAEHRQHSALLARRGIDPSAVREMLADDDVVVADQSGQRAHRENDRQ